MSTTIDPVVLQQLVAQAVRQLQKEGTQAAAPAVPAARDEYGVFTTMADAIDASAAAQHTLLFQSPSQRQQWIDVIRQTCLDKNNMQMMSRMAVEETEIGRYEDKVIKNTAAARYTPGIEDLKTDARTDVTDETSENSENKEEKNELDSVMQANKTMSWMMPILSISIAIIAPLGLALYWLVNNLLMIGERIILDKVIKTEEE